MISLALSRRQVATRHCVTIVVLVAACSGCGSSTPPLKKPAGPSAVPSVLSRPTAPATVSAGPLPAEIAAGHDGAPEPTPVALKFPVGPFLEWQVAQAPIVRGKASLRFTAIPTRESVVELMSYDSIEREDFPSLYVRATTREVTLSSLIGTALEAEMFVMVERDGNMLHSRPGQRAVLRITSLADREVRGTFSGQLYDVETNGSGPLRGAFQAVVDASHH